MVDYVEEIELGATTAQKSRIVPEAVEQAVSLEELAGPMAVAAEPAAHSRCEARCCDGITMISLQVLNEHLSH
jgi:hypothetical protein